MGFVGFRRVSLGFVGIRSDSLGFVGIRWDSLGFVGIRRDSLGFVGIRWDSSGFVGIRWDSLGFTGIRWGPYGGSPGFAEPFLGVRANSELLDRVLAATEPQRLSRLRNLLTGVLDYILSLLEVYLCFLNAFWIPAGKPTDGRQVSGRISELRYYVANGRRFNPSTLPLKRECVPSVLFFAFSDIS